MNWSESEEDLVQEAVDLIWREHGRVNGTPCYEAALRMLQCARAAEERGRRSGVEERDELRACLELARAFVAFQYARNPIPYNRDALACIVKALAPRDSGKEG